VGLGQAKSGGKGDGPEEWRADLKLRREKPRSELKMGGQREEKNRRLGTKNTCSGRRGQGTP